MQGKSWTKNRNFRIAFSYLNKSIATAPIPIPTGIPNIENFL